MVKSVPFPRDRRANQVVSHQSTSCLPEMAVPKAANNLKLTGGSNLKHYLRILALGIPVALAGCAGGKAIKTSADTMMITVSAAPVCGGEGAADYAAKFAAIETIRAGYDGYIIFDAAARNNVRASTLPGTYNTTGSINGNMYSGTTTYTPGPVIVTGRHQQELMIKLFKRGGPGWSNAVNARDVLGPKWQELVANGLRTCS